MSHFFAAFILFARLLCAVLPQTIGVEFSDIPAVVDFGQAITFQVQITSSEPVSKAFVYVAPQGHDPEYYPMTLAMDGAAKYRLETASQPIRVFSHIQYSYRVELASGKSIDSDTYSLDYTDSRFQWRSLQDSSFQIYWYDRDISFGQEAMNIAEKGLDAARKIVAVQGGGPIRIYIYLDPRDLQTAQQGIQPWAAGHAAPDLRMVLVSIPSGPEQGLEMERQIPHELVHILQYQAFGERAHDLPAWLLEGSASVAEFYQNPEYASVLRASAEQDHLLSFESLCQAFPRDASGAFLAYAQSQSFVRYLKDTFGTSGLQSLYQKYADGQSCTAGFEAAFGSSLSEVEYHWRLEALGIDPAALIFRNLLPYLLLFALVFGGAAATILMTARKHRVEVRS